MGWALLALLVVLVISRRDGVQVTPKGDQAHPAAGALTQNGDVSGLAMRILPGSAAAVDWLTGLELDPARVVALPRQADRYSTVRLEPAPWQTKPRFPELKSEIVLGYEPDLVLVSPYSNAAAIARIRKGVPNVLTVTEPASWKSLLAEADHIATAIGDPGAAARLTERLERRRTSLAARGAPKLRVLPYANFGGGGTTSGSDTTIDLALTLAQYINVAAEAGVSGSGDITGEMILTMDFDAILVLADGGSETSQSALSLRGTRVLKDVSAIRDGRFITLPEALYASGSHTLLDAAEEIARQGDALGPARGRR